MYAFNINLFYLKGQEQCSPSDLVHVKVFAGSYFQDLSLILLALHFAVLFSLCHSRNRLTPRLNKPGTLILNTYSMEGKVKETDGGQ